MAKFGAKTEAFLDNMSKKLFNASRVDIGWNREAIYSEDKGGMHVAAIAAQNEFGGTIEIPEHEVTVHRSLDKGGEFNAGARFVKERKSNYDTVHMVPAHTVTIPPRPFFRSMIADEKPYWSSDLRHALNEYNYNAHKALDSMGQLIVADLQKSIKDFTTPANAPSTIARKGFDDPLVDTGHMWKTVKRWVT